MLAQLGAKIIVNDVNEAAAERVAGEVVAQGGHAIAVAASVTDAGDVAEMVDRTMRAWGRIDILVNNAGILRDKSFAKMDLADFRLVVDVHLMGAVICTKAVWEIMRQQHYGRIVMTTSSSGLYGSFGQSNYGAAKMALVGLMQTLSLEGAKYDIRVNCLAPTAATRMTDGILSSEAMERMAPEFASTGLLSLVGDTAPTRAILCAGAGHFALANITLTQGGHIGGGVTAAEQLVERWGLVSDRAGELVPEHGLIQVERELVSARGDVTSSVER
jgi:NAD(P)-dependent dehydrogenase (short-subunit alcohol dehydrogenase family)